MSVFIVIILLWCYSDSHISKRVCNAIDKDTVVCTEAKVAISWNVMRFSQGTVSECK